MTYAEPQHYHVKVRVYNESIDFGKGVAELLQRIEATGSLSAAYKAMGMSASKAWKILRRAEGGRCGRNRVRPGPVPNHVRDRRVNEREPQHHERQQCSKAHAFGDCADDQGGRDRRKRHLKAEVGVFRHHHTVRKGRDFRCR